MIRFPTLPIVGFVMLFMLIVMLKQEFTAILVEKNRGSAHRDCNAEVKLNHFFFFCIKS